jgi:hypothetical protein
VQQAKSETAAAKLFLEAGELYRAAQYMSDGPVRAAVRKLAKEREDRAMEVLNG